MAEVPTRGGVAGTYLQTIVYSYGASQGQGSAWFGPSAPMAPSAPPDVAGRQFDYPVGYNLNTRPRVYEAIGFRELRALADGYDLLRLAIETRKDQLSRMSWSIKHRDSEAKDKGDARVQAITAFLQRPDGEHVWQDWLRPLIEDLFVLDAPALYKRRDRGGQLIELIQIDGANIKPVIDDWGRTPRPYSIGSDVFYPTAYQQILKGLPAVDYSTRDLMYRPRNRRIHTPYGFSPVEQIVTTVNIALRRQLSTLSYFTEGNIPDMMVQVPQTWTPDQIVAYQQHWDAYFSGDLGRRRRAKFVPGGTGTGGIHETRQADLKGDFDEWLAKLICFAFSISPQALTKQMNRASADTQKQLSEEEGLEPILLWIKALIDDVIAFEFDAPDLAFTWDNDDEADETAQLAVLSGYVSKAIMTVNEARDRLGLDPLPDPEASQGMIITGSGAVPLGSFAQQQEQSAANAKLMADAQARQPSVPVGDDGKPMPQNAASKPDPSEAVAKYSADQARGKDGRFASGPSQSTESGSTRRKVILGGIIAGAGALAISALTHKQVPYRSIDRHFANTDLHKAVRDLHTSSVLTPIGEHERRSLVAYTGVQYASINRKLRLGHKPTDDVTNIDSALSKSALSDNTIVYRGVNLDRSNRLLKTQPGETFVDKGYPSTSISEGIARDFAGTNDGAGTGRAAEPGYVVSINIDKGANALPLPGGYTKFPSLHEVLLPRSSAFKVLRVDHDTKTIYAQHMGVLTTKVAAENDMSIGEDVLDGSFDRHLWSDDELDLYDAPDGDRTAEEYADYVPPQPQDDPRPIRKADVGAEPRDQRGEWTAGGATDAKDYSAEDLASAKEAAFGVAKGIALVAASSLAVALAPEVGAFTVVASAASYAADGAFYDAGFKSAKVILRHLGVDTADIEERVKGLVGLGKASAPTTLDATLRAMLDEVSDHLRDEMVAHVEGRHSNATNLADVVAAIKASCEAYKGKLASLGKRYTLGKRRLGTAWRSPEPIPFDRPATAKAEAAISGRLGKAFAKLGADVTKALRKAEKVAKAAPDDPDPEDVEDRARHRADEIVSEFDLGSLYAEAEPIGADLEDVVNDTVARAVAQVGPDDKGGLVSQVNARAVAIARERAAELVGMHYDTDGKLVPSDDVEMAITDTTRDMLRQTIAEDLAAGKTTDEIADDIASNYAFSPERAAVIAATEVSRANSMAALESYQAAADVGVPLRKQWLAEADCCDVCSANAAAGAIDLDDTFPSGDNTPPGHPNCRCSLTPAIGEDNANKVRKTYDPGESRDAKGKWVSASLSDVVKASRSRSGRVLRRVVSPVRKAAEVGAIAGIDVRGFRHTISSVGVTHTLKQHGSEAKEKARGQIAVKDSDFGIIGQIVAQPDHIASGEDLGRSLQPRIVFRREIDGVTYHYVGEVQSGKRRIEMVTMWKK